MSIFVAYIDDDRDVGESILEALTAYKIKAQNREQLVEAGVTDPARAASDWFDVFLVWLRLSKRSIFALVLLALKYKLDPDRFVPKNRPIDFRPVERIDLFNPGNRPPFRHVWFKTKTPLPDIKQIHSYVLAYISDFNLLLTALLPHDARLFQGKLKLASLDHAMWFHRDFKADEWLLYALDSPSASNARGFCRGSIFSRDGKLVASVAQEGLIRLRKPD